MEALQQPAKEREFPFGDREFETIVRIVGENAGIRLTAAKKDMVYSRLSRRLRQLGLSDFVSYCRLLEEDEGEELGNLINAITTNLTAFFRENHHFEYLRGSLVPELMQRNAKTRRIRIWSAGCSTGEEPYSIAIALREALPRTGWDVKVLATDLDSNVVATGAAGVYPLERVKGMAPERLSRWFMRGNGANAGMVRVKSDLKDIIRFRQLNLLRPWPFKGPFDAIFCRNVVIYFDKETQRGLFDRYADLLAPDGWLFIGHSESLFKVSERFKLIGNTIYRRLD